VHLTELDHELDLPTPQLRPDRDFGGQRFVWHRAADAPWQPWRVDGFECRDSVAGVRVVRAVPGSPLAAPRSDDAELVFWFVLTGRAVLRLDDGAASEPLRRGDAVAVPGGRRWQLAEPSPDFELLDVTLPAVP
jgi:mannose-6-phosphate isomerase-like protein (cupin superfamily)